MRVFPAAFLLILGSASALAVAFGGGSGGGSELADPPPPPANTVFAGVLLRVGLGADTLAAAGITSVQVPTLVAAVRGAYDAGTMLARDEAYLSARRTHDLLRRLIQSGKGTQEDVAARSTAEAALNTATAAREGYLLAARQAALATVSPEQAALVTRIRANRSWGLPIQYLVKDRAETEWVLLREALAAKRISEQDEEEEFDPSARDAVAAADAQTEVATAKVNLDSGLAGVQAAWNTAATD